LFAPTGTVGVEYAHALHPNVELVVGAGVGYLILAAAGDDYRPTPHAAIMPRYRMRFGAVRLHVGAGFSVGEEQEGYSPFSGYEGVDRFYGLMANVEGGVQVMSRSGWFGRATIGYSHLLAHTDATSTDPGRAPRMNIELAVPYLGIGVGRTL
jgi:hypothetical protein